MRAHLHSLALHLSLVMALTVLGLLSLGAPQALAAAHAGGSGSITGMVANGSHGNAAVAGQQVTLQLTVGSNARDVASATTDAQGQFSFTGIDLSTSDALGGSYAVYTTFQGGVYATGAINLNASANQTTTLLVYDATQDSSKLLVSIATILVRQPDVKHGLVGIGEFITIYNSGDTAFVGSLPTGGSTAAMPSLLRFSLPPNAQNVTLGVGFFNTTTIQIGTGFAAATTVPPGQSQFAFAYDLPYTGTTLSVPFKAEYPASQVVTLIPPNMLVRDATGGAAAQGIVTSFGARYQVYTATNVATGGVATVNLYDLPKPGETQDLNSMALLWLAGGVCALLALLLALYLRRGALASVFGLIPATLHGTHTPAAAGASDAERDGLLRDLLALERRKASGAISDEQFKREDATLRARLRESLAGGPTCQPLEASADDDGAVEITQLTSGGQR